MGALGEMRDRGIEVLRRKSEAYGIIVHIETRPHTRGSVDGTVVNVWLWHIRPLGLLLTMWHDPAESV